MNSASIELPDASRDLVILQAAVDGLFSTVAVPVEADECRVEAMAVGVVKLLRLALAQDEASVRDVLVNAQEFRELSSYSDWNPAELN